MQGSSDALFNTSDRQTCKSLEGELRCLKVLESTDQSPSILLEKAPPFVRILFREECLAGEYVHARNPFPIRVRAPSSTLSNRSWNTILVVSTCAYISLNFVPCLYFKTFQVFGRILILCQASGTFNPWIDLNSLSIRGNLKKRSNW